MPYALIFLLVVSSGLTLGGCESAQRSASTREGSANGETARCPIRVAAGSTLPDTPHELERAETWLARYPAEELDRPLLDPQSLRTHNAALRIASDGVPRLTDLTRTPPLDELLMALSERLGAYRARVMRREYKLAKPSERSRLEIAPPASFRPAPVLRTALETVDISCVPVLEPIRSTVDDPTIDRNRCSQVRPQEVLEVLGSFGADALVVRARVGWGFISSKVALGPAVPDELAAGYRDGPDLTLRADTTVNGVRLSQGALLEAAVPDERSIWLATAQGYQRVTLSESLTVPTQRPLTRRAALEEAFSFLGGRYGWGDQAGGRDCSRFVLDVLARFGLQFPRTSGEQSLSGSYSLEIPGQASESERLALLDEANQRGLVLIHFPGHIMLYLGRDAHAVPRVIHSLAEYARPCEPSGETIVEVGRVAVSDLSLGKNSTRRSLLERITRLTVLGAPPGHALLSFAQFRPALPPVELAPKLCSDGLDAALFHSPRAARSDAPLRVIAVTQEETRPAALWLVSPQGKLVQSAIHELGVGPFARWVELMAPEPGRWTALLADGPRLIACERFNVARAAPTGRLPPPEGELVEMPAWKGPLKWERDTEALYAAFVEQLFSVAPDAPSSWSGLTPLLADRKQNLLFNHLGWGEDERVKLAPDCADLPYFLRAYFAWKLGLPFAFRRCSRGREGVAPRCGELTSNEAAVAARDPVSAFEAFIRLQVSAGVHSASGRTLPEDEQTDLYPIPLRREALRPGTVYADPYGHVIVVAKWIPQGLAGAGMLLGADAQPDATVALKRFWRGNFLFSPNTRDVGAGFKAFRPVVRNVTSASLVTLDSAALADQREFPAPSLEQYQGTMSDFYARMDELIYPRPISIPDRLQQVVSALHEQVLRRAEAVDVGEAGMKAVAQPISMPEGYAIFETSGPWEDFATPSRDMRLLIALDAARELPEQVRARPERFGLRANEGEQRSVEAKRALEKQLARQTFQYTRSDGSKQVLTLAQLLLRSDALEMAYNPNDCVETRWGALEGSAEAATCARHAPAKQRAQMEKYRGWFSTRTRPPRP